MDEACDTEFNINRFLDLYPELKDGRTGTYDITALQVRFNRIEMHIQNLSVVYNCRRNYYCK